MFIFVRFFLDKSGYNDHEHHDRDHYDIEGTRRDIGGSVSITSPKVRAQSRPRKH